MSVVYHQFFLEILKYVRLFHDSKTIKHLCPKSIQNDEDYVYCDAISHIKPIMYPNDSMKVHLYL